MLHLVVCNPTTYTELIIGKTNVFVGRFDKPIRPGDDLLFVDAGRSLERKALRFHGSTHADFLVVELVPINQDGKTFEQLDKEIGELLEASVPWPGDAVVADDNALVVIRNPDGSIVVTVRGA